MLRETALQYSAISIASTTIASYVFSFFSRSLAIKYGAMDIPSQIRKIHRSPTPLWGGLGIAISIFFTVFILQSSLIFIGSSIRIEQVYGFVIGVCVLLIGGLIDDVYPLPPRIQVIFPSIAALVVICTGTGIIQITQIGSTHAFSLVWWKFFISGFQFSLPSDIITFIWLLIATYATKILDGLDGLVSGVLIIGCGFVAVLGLAPRFFQPDIAILACGILGSFLGFLPRNTHPAKQFLGESGSTIAGFSLGVLAILGSAKVAIALSALAIPITDIALVMLGRIRRGASPFIGDDTHLHFRLIQLGLSQRMAVGVYWGMSLLAGIFALGLQTRGKIFLIAFLIVLTVLTSYLARIKIQKKI